MHRIVADDAPAPQVFDQFVFADDLPMALCKVHQHLHRQVLQINTGTIFADLIELWRDEPLADAEFGLDGPGAMHFIVGHRR